MTTQTAEQTDTQATLRLALDALMVQPTSRTIEAPDGLMYHVRTFTPEQARQRVEAKRAIRRLLA